MEIYVVGGTEYDARKGVKYLDRNGVAAKEIAISNDPQVQGRLHANPADVTEEFKRKLAGIKNAIVLIYCNSLSFAINWPDVDSLLQRNGIVVRDMREMYFRMVAEKGESKIGLIVADKITFDRISKALKVEFPELEIVGSYGIPLVRLFEENVPMAKLELQHTIMSLIEENINKVLLGCTHFEVDQEFNPPVDLVDPGRLFLDEFIADNI